MRSSSEKVLLAGIPGLRGGWKLATRSFLGAEVWGEVGDLVGGDTPTCSVQVDSDTGCSSAVDRLFEVFVWQVLRFEGVPFRELVEFLRCFEPAVSKSLRPLVSFFGPRCSFVASS